jgi:hypothetical protein
LDGVGKAMIKLPSDAAPAIYGDKQPRQRKAWVHGRLTGMADDTTLEPTLPTLEQMQQ